MKNITIWSIKRKMNLRSFLLKDSGKEVNVEDVGRASSITGKVLGS